MSSSNRRPYASATVLDQTLLDDSSDNLVHKLEMIADVETPTGTIHISDRAKYVGGVYYEPRVQFPDINRTIGEWLSNELEFSSLDLSINNTDQKYNNLLQGGADYEGFIGRRITVKIGLAEIASTYTEVFSGVVTDAAGFGRDVLSFKLTARNDFERVNLLIPQQFFIEDDFPDIEDNFIGLGAPVIYGDWTTNLRPEGSEVPAFPVNGNDIAVNESLEDPSAGDTPLKLVVSSTPIKSFDTATVTLFRGDAYYIFDASDINIVPATDNTAFEITQKNLDVDGTPFIYNTGDEFYVRVVGVDLGTVTDNIVAQAKDMIKRFAGLVDADFTLNWATYQGKTTPTESAISTMKSRVWIQEGTEMFKYVASMLEQVRLEPFVNRDNKFDLSSLHFDDFTTKLAAVDMTVKNWDVVRGTFKPQIDERNNWNRAKADFDFNPAKGEQQRSTALYRNQDAIDQAGKPISKLVVFPNLYVKTDVVNQLIEMLKLASSYSEMIDMGLTSRAIRQELGDFVKLDVKIGSIEMDEIPAMIRSIQYSPEGLELPVKVWSFQMVGFFGYTAPAGWVGGVAATITKET